MNLLEESRVTSMDDGGQGWEGGPDHSPWYEWSATPDYTKQLEQLSTVRTHTHIPEIDTCTYRPSQTTVVGYQSLEENSWLLDI